MAHSYVMSFPDELSAFRAFAADFPENSVLLIDTYDTIKGAERAILVARERAARGPRLRGVRIDSGDLVATSRQVRARLNAAGLRGTTIVLSGGLNEFKVADLLQAGAVADAFGVGTELGTSADAPFVEGVYKLVEDAEGYRVKLSTGKATLPGRKQVWRTADTKGIPQHDTIALAEETGPPGAGPLLVEVMRDGRTVRPDGLDEMRARCRERLGALPPPPPLLPGGGTLRVAVLVAAAATGGPPAVAGPGQITVLVDGTVLALDVPPVQIEGRVLVPLLGSFERLGAPVVFDSTTQALTA